MKYKKYVYKGKKLRDYCQEENIDYDKLKRRIMKFRSVDPSIEDEKIIEMALEDLFGPKSVKAYKYRFPELADYCRERGLDYSKVHNQVKYLSSLDKYKDYDINKIVELVMDDEFKKSNSKYFYKGIPIRKYCKDNNLRFTVVMGRISTFKQANPEYSDEEVVELVIDTLNSKRPRGHLCRIPKLAHYCFKNNLDYQKMLAKVMYMSKLEKYKEYNEEELAQMLMDGDLKKDNAKYFYNGISIGQYCKENNLNRSSVLGRITYIKRKNPQYSIQQVVDLAMEPYNYSKYNYKGLTLFEYCNEYGFNYIQIFNKFSYYRSLPKYQAYSNEQIIEMAINHENRRNIIIYKDLPLEKYCARNGLNFLRIKANITRYKNNNMLSELTQEQIIELAINSYLKVENKKHIKSILNKKNMNIDEVKFLCESYKIDYDCVEKLTSKCSLNTSFYIVYYFGNSFDLKGNKQINNEQIKYIRNLLNKIKNQNTSDISCYDLIRVYKCKLIDTRKDILLNVDQFVIEKVMELLDELKIENNKTTVNRLKKIAKSAYIEALDNVINSDEKIIFSYINKWVSTKLKNVIKKHIDCSEEILKDNEEEEYLINEEFNQTNLNYVEDLSNDEKEYLKLKYEFKYTYGQLCDFYNLSKSEIMEKENKILSKLKVQIKNKKL